MHNHLTDEKIDLADNQLTTETDEAALRRVLERKSASDKTPSPRD